MDRNGDLWMKKIVLAVLTAAILTAALTGCNRGNTNSSSAAESSSEPPAQSSEAPEASAQTDGHISVDSILDAIAGAYGENYPGNADIPPEVLDAELGLSPDLYTEAKGRMAMISVHNDRVVVARAAEGKADDLENAFNNARQKMIDDSMQYPANIAKTNAAKVVRNGDYVAFLLVGVPRDAGDVTEAEDKAYAESEVQKAVDAFNGVFA